MGQAFDPHRPAVIDRSLEEELSEYLRFRHVFRHTYGYDLDWKRVRELSEALPEMLAGLKVQLKAFLSTVEGG